MINTCPRCGSARVKQYWMSGGWFCKDCLSEFPAPAKVKGISWNTVLLCLSAWLVGFAVLLVGFASATATAMSPNIYLYTLGETKERVKLTVKGTVTARIPWRPGARSVVWRDLTLKGGKILDSGRQYDYLFYESETVVPRHDETGWVLERKSGKFTWNGEPADRDALVARFGEILAKYGLFEQEVEDFREQMLGPDLKMFPGKDATYAIHPIPAGELDRIFRIETDLEYPERIRVQFLVREVPEGTVLEAPEIPEVRRAECALHEWGVVRA